jgi:glycosyltransferase involved in cell wall biosynthesis
VFSLHIDTARTWRGGQQQTLLTVLGLRARGHRAVLAAHPDGELFRRAAEGSDLIPLAPKGDVDLAAAWKLSRLIRQWQPTIVHAHDPHAVSMAGLALSFAAPSPRPKVIASRRVDFHLQGHSFSQWKYRQVDGFIAASGAIRDILVNDGIDRSRIIVVHDGIDVERIEGLPPIDIHAEYWLPRGSPVVVNVGALVGHKGQKHLIDAAALVMREVPDVHVVIFGEGELRAPLEKQIKHLGLDKRILLPGFREDVLSLVKSADLFVMSSVTEGLGSAVLDAMAMGLAVVGTRAGGIPEAVVSGTTGLIVEPGEPQPLADAIVQLLADPGLRQQYGEAGRRRVSEWFGVERLVEGTLAAYERFGSAEASTSG